MTKTFLRLHISYSCVEQFYKTIELLKYRISLFSSHLNLPKNTKVNNFLPKDAS